MNYSVRGLQQAPPDRSLLEGRKKLLKDFPVLCPCDEVLLEVRTCMKCNEWGIALENLGALGCRFHPLQKNGPSGGKWHGEGVYECCGTSDDPRHKDFHARIGKRGCCAKDHCPLERMPYPRRIYEKDWPSVLRERVYVDINKINNESGNRTWSEIVKGLRFKGLRIDENDRFYLARIDEEACEARLKHKFYRDQKLSRCLRVHQINDEGDERVAEKVSEVIVADDALIEKSFDGNLYDSDKYDKILTGPCAQLEEGKDYFLRK